ncbi:MAG TPA: hypothetical protein VNW97_14615 [Candidatus Saccharimonadales bacterium]|nr:hypothetical protein [Candidatus Saccharimonadales bacterium]
MHKKLIVILFALCILPGLAQDQSKTSAKAPTNTELLAKGKVFFVKSNTFFVKKEELERGLLNNKELDRWGLQLTQNENEADFVLRVKRAAFQNNFPYTVTDRDTGRILIAGEPNSLGGTVPGKIAADIARKIKEK